ncbi:MAG TPA: CRISPR-associated RAMP protein [Anaerolineae bacterium]|nr:CRISPR-associated RAMP protein [Anaerolineae bacterium]
MRGDNLLDMRAFHSRLILRGTLELRTGLRLGAGRDTQIEAAADLPVVKMADGRPYIPGASFKGAWRAATEALLRGLPDHQAKNLACVSVPRDEETIPPLICLTAAAVGRLKTTPPEKWAEILDGRAAQVQDKSLDQALRALSCRTCRLFGAPWLAGKVLVKDLAVGAGWGELTRPAVRDGVAIDRDKGSAAPKKKYTYEVVPAGTPFAVEIVVENADAAELGLAWLGLLAFQQGQIPLGGARSRGLGWCVFQVNWPRSQWLTRDNLLESLFPDDPAALPGSLAEDGAAQAAGWLSTFLREIGLEGGSDE